MSSQMFAQQSPVRQYLPWICTSLAIGYAAYIHWRSRCQRKKIQINLDKKHARSCEVNIDDIDRNQTKKKISYCRCWKSETFPLCDGVHKCHNRENDDSVGPLNLVWRDDNVVESGDATTKAATDPTRQTESKSPINDPDMDIKSIDSLESDHSPILGVSGSANGSNGSDDFDDQLVKIDSNAAAAGSSSSSSNNKNNADVTTTTSTPNRSSNMNDDGHHSHNTSVNNNSNSNNLTDEQLSSLEMIDDDNNFTTVNNDNDNDGQQQQQSTP